MKWFIAIIVLIALWSATFKMWEVDDSSTLMAGFIFFIVLPYTGMFIAKVYESREH